MAHGRVHPPVSLSAESPRDSKTKEGGFGGGRVGVFRVERTGAESWEARKRGGEDETDEVANSVWGYGRVGVRWPGIRTHARRILCAKEIPSSRLLRPCPAPMDFRGGGQGEGPPRTISTWEFGQ